VKPLIHCKSSVRKWGGTVDDYMKIHEWFDQTKAHVADVRHRAILHNAFGIYLRKHKTFTLGQMKREHGIVD
jgi:nitrous oxidase accessory protein NosD